MEKSLKSKREKKQLKRIPKYKYFIAFILTSFIVLLPWISQLKIINLTDDLSKVFTNTKGFNIDFFLYYKEVLIITIGIFIVLFFIGERIFPDYIINDYPIREKKNKIILVCISVYIISVIMSTVLSKYRQLSLMGSPTECEGIFVLITYMILFLAGMNYFYYNKSIKILKNGLVILMTLMVLLSLVEFLYKPIFEIPIFQSLLASKDYSELVKTMKTSGFDGMISLTMYNPNYVGALCVLLFPISVTNFISEKNKVAKVYMQFISAGMIFCTFAAKATAAIYIVIFEGIFLIIYYLRKKVMTIKNIAYYCLLTIIVFSFINLFSNNLLIKNIVEGYKNTPSIINNKEKFILKGIDINKDLLKLQGENKTLIIKGELNNNSEDIKLNFYDEINNEVIGNKEIINEEEVFTFNNKEFSAIKVKDVGYGIIIDIGYNDTMNFYVTEDGFKGVGQNGIPIDDISVANRFLTKLYPLATGRGYTWVNSLPILKETLLLGKGPGSFAMYFKQNDYLGLMNTHGSTKFVIDKPHNMYLQTAIQIGGIALVALLILFAIVISRILKKYFSITNFYNEDILATGILVGVIGFLIVSLVYDSIVTVNPIFWILLGACYSITYCNKSNDKVAKI